MQKGSLIRSSRRQGPVAGGGARIRGDQFGVSFELFIPQGFASLTRNGSFRNRRTTGLTRREKTMGR